MGSLKLLTRSVVLVLIGIACSCSSNGDDDNTDDVGNAIQLTVEGRYTGLIELTISGDLVRVPVSLTVQETAPTRFSGNFYETAEFRPCCSTNPQDGTFTFDYDQSEMIIDYFEIRVNFNSIPDNPCTGVYRGSGEVEFDETSLIMAEILINDCNVSDTMGTLSLSKIGEL